MKKINLIALLLLFCIKVTAQHAQDVPGKRAIANPQTVYPVFLNRIGVEKDFKTYVNLEKVYSRLKAKKSSAIAEFSFMINQQGKIIPKRYPKSILIEGLKKYFDKQFINYRFKPAYLKGKSNKLEQLAVFTVIFDTTRKEISLDIQAIDEGSIDLYSKTIKMY